ncbi:hypothetical protein C5E05_19430 [Pseudoclavibacter sp. AY1H1]|nr:hypothetical protein C5E05_19430 [Pseudoclavibacter sp. AY1H1]
MLELFPQTSYGKSAIPLRSARQQSVSFSGDDKELVATESPDDASTHAQHSALSYRELTDQLTHRGAQVGTHITLCNLRS